VEFAKMHQKGQPLKDMSIFEDVLRYDVDVEVDLRESRQMRIFSVVSWTGTIG
jgi:hypothetical protein